MKLIIFLLIFCFTKFNLSYSNLFRNNNHTKINYIDYYKGLIKETHKNFDLNLKQNSVRLLTENYIESQCDSSCKEFYYCDNSTTQCVHKGFFPIYPSEVLQLLLVCGVSLIATTCGIGGMI